MKTLIKSYRYRGSSPKQKLFTVSKPRKVECNERNNHNRFA
jgi:hypothetical protein